MDFHAEYERHSRGKMVRAARKIAYLALRMSAQTAAPLPWLKPLIVVREPVRKKHKLGRLQAWILVRALEGVATARERLRQRKEEFLSLAKAFGSAGASLFPYAKNLKMAHLSSRDILTGYFGIQPRTKALDWQSAYLRKLALGRANTSLCRSLRTLRARGWLYPTGSIRLTSAGRRIARKLRPN